MKYVSVNLKLFLNTISNMNIKLQWLLQRKLPINIQYTLYITSPDKKWINEICTLLSQTKG